MLTSARYFLLTRRDAEPPGVVLDIRFRCQADKGLLLEIEPDNALIDGLERQGQRHLADWLGRRYEREAVSDADTEGLVNPFGGVGGLCPSKGQSWLPNGPDGWPNPI